MKQLALADGDLVVTPAGHKTISGAARITQDLRCALIEPLGNDRFHRDWGSIIRSYIGQTLTEEVALLVESEANRVLQNYVLVQRAQVLGDFTAQRASRYDTSDVVRAIQDIRVQINFDTVTVFVVLVTQANQRVTIPLTVGA
jgi:phage baseplate assembly protein W